jgi:imidazoleglycerol-phosphate dehydratase
MNRRAEIARDTKETKIRVAVDLDGTGVSQIATGIGLNHDCIKTTTRHAQCRKWNDDARPCIRRHAT